MRTGWISILRVSAVLSAVGFTITAPSASAAGCTLGVMANLPVTMEGRRASVPLKVNGRDTSFWLDSGAFFSIMPKSKAVELGLKLEAAPQGLYLIGIGGSASVQLTTIKTFGIVGQEVKNVQFLVGGSDAGNGLIGRNILAMADTEFDLADGSVKLIRPRGCGKSAMTYWAPDKPHFSVPLQSSPNPADHLFKVTVNINGARVVAELDTGAPNSLVSRGAAERAGIDLSSADAIPITNINGFGRRSHGGWSVPVATFAIGDEQILKTHLTVIDGPIAAGEGSPDMLLGADFMMAHHIYVSREQGQIYFTYSGGRPFLTEQIANAAPMKRSSSALPTGLHEVEAVAAAGGDPKTAEEFGRRGNARLMQGKVVDGIADLTAAIHLAPNTASYYRVRAKAYFRSGERALARADVDQALTLDPENDDMLRARAAMRLAQHDQVGALADTNAAARVTPPSSLEAIEVAQLYVRLHRPALGIPIYDAVIAVHREDSRLGALLNGRCWLRALANVDLDKALDDCTRAIKRDGLNAAYLDSRGLVYFRKGQLNTAITDYDAALKLNPNIAWSRYVRGTAKIVLGQIDSGKADQTASLQAQPDIADEMRAYGIDVSATTTSAH